MNKMSIVIIIIIVLAAAIGGYFLLNGYKPTSASTTGNGNTNPPVTQTPGTLPSGNLPSTTPPSITPLPTTIPPTTTPPSTTLPPAPQPVSVAIQNFAFSPNSVTIKVGTKVTWTNQDSVPHTITSDSSSAANFSSSSLSTNQSFRFTFMMPGTHTYHCSIHPFMTGTIIVTQ